MTQTVEQLFLESERQAQRFAGYVRVAVGVGLMAFFLVAHPPAISRSFVTLVVLAFLVYCALGVLSIAVASARRFRPSFALPLAMIDMALYAVVAVASALTVDLPLSAFGATPPFLLGFVILALAGMRYDPRLVGAVALAGAALAAAVAIADGAGWLPAVGEARYDVLRATILSERANWIRLTMLAVVAAIVALTMLRTRRTVREAIALTQQRAELSRYLPRAVARKVASEGVAALGRGRVQPAGVLFADVRGFTALSETLAPEALGALLGELRSLQRRVIDAQGGIVDKFIGDAAMAVFGVPDPAPDDGRRALAAALALHAAHAAWNDRRRQGGLPAVQVGIGLHFGEVFAGAIGDEARLEFATLGDTVNVAQRLEDLTKDLATPLLVSRDALVAAGADLADWEALPPQPVRGRSRPVEVFRPRPDAETAGAANRRSGAA